MVCQAALDFQVADRANHPLPPPIAASPEFP
jgi:hypothetical protein